MRILHTSDWHLGKKLERISRLPEQKEVTAEIVETARAAKADIVIIAGDIFDTFNPSGEAEELFYDRVCEMSEFCTVIVVPGNHDDAAGLCAAGALAGRSCIYLLGDMSLPPCAGGKGRLRVEESGKGYIILSDGAERAVIAYLPFPLDSRIGRQLNETVDREESYSGRISRWFGLGAKAFCKDTVNIGISHLFVAGSEKAGDEYEIELGTAKLVDKSALPATDYLALGHVHKYQKVSSERNAYYSGSILQYSFDDKADKCVLIADLHAGVPPVIEKHLLKSGKRLISLTADSLAAAEELLKEHGGELIDLTLNLPAPLLDSENKELSARFPNIAKRRLILPETENTEITKRASKSNSEIFKAFYKSRRGGDAPEELTALFAELMENNNETGQS